jgi:1-acyl-sn-glycerol-3-phosphate acyltransferase
VDKLREGYVLVMFPEGGRSKEGDVGSGRRGVGMIAALSGAPVVPACIEGTDRAMPIGSWFIRPAKVTVTMGTPLDHGSSENNKEYQKRITDDIMERIRGLKEGSDIPS